MCHIKFIDNEDIPNYFIQSDFLILPYEDSTQSGPLLIAYNYNLPIISSDLDYFKEMIANEKTGFIFERGNQDSLENVIERAINMEDSQYCQMKMLMSEKVERYKSNCNFLASFDNFVKIYIPV